MIALSLAFMLYLVSSPAWALQSDVGGLLESRLAAQETSIDQQLSDYLDQDDIQGALTFVEKLAADGTVDSKGQRALEDKIWRTKTQRMLEYSKKIREAIKVSDLDAMRDYNQRLRRLRESRRSEAEPEQTDEAVQTVEPATAVEPAAVNGALDVVDVVPEETESLVSEVEELVTPTQPSIDDQPGDAFNADQSAIEETAALAEASTETEVRGPAGGPVLGFPPTRTAIASLEEPASDVSTTSTRPNGVPLPSVRLGNVPKSTRHQVLINDVISDLLERADRAIAEFHLTVAPEGTDSALGIVEKLLIIGIDGEPAAEKVGQKILTAYEDLVQRDIERGRYDKASVFIERMDEVAATAGLPRDDIEALRAELDAASG